jgi:hypothetical protein
VGGRVREMTSLTLELEGKVRAAEDAATKTQVT